MQAEKEPSSQGMTWACAVLGGIAIGAVAASFAGFVIGVLLGIGFAQVLFLRKRARDLQQQVTELRASRVHSELAMEAEPKREPAASYPVREAPPVSAVSAAPPIIPKINEPQATSPATRTEASTQITPPTIRRRVAKAEPDWADRQIAFALAWLKGGNPLARIGVVILFFGAVFLAKYAADHSMFPLELRFISIAGGALALLIVGWRLREKRAAYAEILQGGGIAGLYLTVYSAASLYHLLPLTLAFGLMVFIALAAAILALAQNALSLAVIGTAGGFLAPILVSAGSGNHVALFTYYAILNVGIFAVAWFRTWRMLNVLGFLFTFTITGLWRASGYGPEDLLSADSFLILFFSMYVGVSILNCVRQPPNLKGYVSGSLVFGLPIVAFTLHATLVSGIEYALAWSALAIGTFYLVIAWSLLRSRRESFRLLIESFAALGIIFASLAIPLAFDTRMTAAMWAVEGAGLLWLGVRQQRKLARAFGALLQVAGGVGYLIGLRHSYDALPVLNTAYLGAVMLALSGLFTGWTLYRNREQRASYEVGASEAFALWGTAWWLVGGISEIGRLSSQWAPSAWALGAALIYVTATCAVLRLLGVKLVWPMARLIALFLPCAAGAFCALVAIDAHHPFAEGGFVGWTALFLVFYWTLRHAEVEQLAPTAHATLHAGAAWSLVGLLAWEATWQVDWYAAGVWPSLPLGVVPMLALALLARRTLKPKWPMARHADVYRLLIAAPVAIAIALWIAIVNGFSIGDPLWLPYLPVLNPLDVCVALCFVAVALWWTALDDSQRARLWPGDPRILIAVAASLVFWWLNAALIRSLHHNFGAPITFYGIVRSQFVQAALSIFWAVLGFAAMTLAARKNWRYVWLVGGALMLVVVAKLFLIDLSNVGTIARIVSFLTIGALIVVTGYLAPLPPRRAQDDEPSVGNAQEETVKP
jgi:uncharacterized membrane protein